MDSPTHIKTLTVFFLLFFIVSCSSNKKEDIRNACLEMNATSVGFSGPSKRIDIMKSYDFSLEQADLLNTFIKTSSDVGMAWSHDALKSSCIKQVFVCEEALGEISEGPDNYLPIWKRKMDACGASSPF